MRDRENAKRLVNALCRNVVDARDLEVLSRLLNYDKSQLQKDLASLEAVSPLLFRVDED